MVLFSVPPAMEAREMSYWMNDPKRPPCCGGWMLPDLESEGTGWICNCCRRRAPKVVAEVEDDIVEAQLVRGPGWHAPTKMEVVPFTACAAPANIDEVLREQFEALMEDQGSVRFFKLRKFLLEPFER
jgi:hypothetical protein